MVDLGRAERLRVCVGIQNKVYFVIGSRKLHGTLRTSSLPPGILEYKLLEIHQVKHLSLSTSFIGLLGAQTPTQH